MTRRNERPAHQLRKIAKRFSRTTQRHLRLSNHENSQCNHLNGVAMVKNRAGQRDRLKFLYPIFELGDTMSTATKLFFVTAMSFCSA
jgi:hypothetical protein